MDRLAVLLDIVKSEMETTLTVKVPEWVKEPLVPVTVTV